MNALGAFLAMALVAGERPHVLSGPTAADRVTLRDGTVVRGLVTSATNGNRGSVEMIVRRNWAAKNLKKQLTTWEHSEAAAAKTVNDQRRRRLSAWKRERTDGPGPNDPIMGWIDRELAALADPKNIHRSILLSVRIPRADVQIADRPPAPVERLLRLGWLSKIPNPEEMSVEQMKVSLEARGYDIDAESRSQPPNLDRLLAPVVESEAQWLTRRAATEVSVDDGLRFVRFNEMIMPDSRGGVLAAGDLNLTAALSQLERVLDLQSGPRVDPLIERLRAIAARGRIGAVVTRMEIAPDMSGVNVESTLWVRTGPDRWQIYGSRQSQVRTDDLPADAGKGLDQDPQVQGAFKIVEMLGLGAIPGDLKQRSLRIGAATQKAIGTARTDFSQELDKLTLPVLEPVGDALQPGRPGDQGKPS
jgi:hypothetical protein